MIATSAGETRPDVGAPRRVFDDPSLSNLVRSSLEEFMFHLSLVRAVSSRTVEAYGRDLRALFLHLAAEEGIIGPLQITPAALRNYLIHLSVMGRQPATIARARSAIRTYFAHMVDEGLVTDDPSADLEAPAGWKRVPRALSEEEAARLIDSITGSKKIDYRDRALMEIAYGTGARVSEMLSIRLDDCLWEQKLVRLSGKGNKIRLVPLGEPAIVAIRAYTIEARPKFIKGCKTVPPQLFLNARGGTLSRMGFWKILRKRALQAGLGEGIHPHLLRHSYATHLLRGGASLRVVQELLGHSRLGTTQIYTSVDEPYLKSMHEKYHPRG